MDNTKSGTNLHVRLESAAQQRRWKAAAKADGRSLSSWIRARLDAAAKSELKKAT